LKVKPVLVVASYKTFNIFVQGGVKKDSKKIIFVTDRPPRWEEEKSDSDSDSERERGRTRSE